MKGRINKHKEGKIKRRIKNKNKKKNDKKTEKRDT